MTCVLILTVLLQRWHLKRRSRLPEGCLLPIAYFTFQASGFVSSVEFCFKHPVMFQTFSDQLSIFLSKICRDPDAAILVRISDMALQ